MGARNFIRHLNPMQYHHVIMNLPDIEPDYLNVLFMAEVNLEPSISYLLLWGGKD